MAYSISPNHKHCSGPSANIATSMKHSAVATSVLGIHADVCVNPRLVIVAAASSKDHAAAAVGAFEVDLRSVRDALVSATIQIQQHQSPETSNPDDKWGCKDLSFLFC